MSANLIIGASHALQFAAAAGRFQADWKQASQDLVRLDTASGAETWLLFVTNRPEFMTLQAGPRGEAVASFGPLMDRIRAFDRPDAKVVFNIGGNEHNIRFLCAQPKPFDFLHPSWPGVIPGRQIIPAATMAGIVRGLLERTLLVTRLIAAELPRAQRYCLAPPPPIASEAQIRTNPAIFDFDANGIEDAGVRLKIYSLYVELLAEFCAAQGLSFLPPRPENRDGRGFLAEPYWNGSTHATPEYYRRDVTELGL